MNTIKPTLIGRQITLRPLTAGDADAMFASLRDEEAMRLTGTKAVHTLDDVKTHLANCENSQDRFDFAIIAQGELAGEVVLNNIDRLNECASFRIALWYDRFRNRGYGSEATELMVEHSFTVLGLNRIELEVFSFNPRAIHVYEQIGFVYEGTRRQALYWDGEWIDAHMMAMLRKDFIGNTDDL